MESPVSAQMLSRDFFENRWRLLLGVDRLPWQPFCGLRVEQVHVFLTYTNRAF